MLAEQNLMARVRGSILGMFVLILALPGPAVVQCQVGASRRYFQRSMRELGAGRQEHWAADAGVKSYRFRLVSSANGMLEGLTCVAAFESDRAVRVSWGPFSEDHSWDQTLALVSAGSWQFEDGQAQRKPLFYRPEYRTVFPPLGTWSAKYLPIWKTTYVLRSPSVDKRGTVHNMVTWQPLSQMTGDVQVIPSQHLADLAILTSADGLLVASVWATDVQGVRSRDFQVHHVTFYDASFFWREGFAHIESGTGEYELRLAQAVPPEAQASVRGRRLVASLLFALDGSSVPLPILQKEFERLVRAIPEARRSIRAGIAKNLLSAPLAVKARRVGFLESAFDVRDAIPIIVPLVGSNDKTRELAVETLQRMAIRHSLLYMPDISSDSKEWTRWCETVVQGRGGD